MSTTTAHSVPSHVEFTPTADRRAFTSGEIAFMVGVPLLWAVLLLFHPGGDVGSMYQSVRDKVTPWLTVHIGMMLFIPLMAAAVYVLLRDAPGTAARVARVALVPFALFYTIWEALQGIATGVLIHNVNGLQGAERATGADLVQNFGENALVRDLGILGSIGSVAFLVAMIAAAVAFRRAGAPLGVPVLLGLAGFLITAHPPPYGPTGLVLFAVAVLLVLRWRGRAVSEAA